MKEYGLPSRGGGWRAMADVGSTLVDNMVKYDVCKVDRFGYF